MKLFSTIAAAATVIVVSFVTSTPAKADYYSYTTRPSVGGGYRWSDSNGNYGSVRPSVGGGYRFSNSSGGYGSIRPSVGGGYRVNYSY